MSSGTSLKVSPKPRGPRQQLFFLCGLALPLAVLATVAAHGLLMLIAAVTQLCFFGTFSTEWVPPSENQLGPWVILIPALGGGVIALMARYGSRAVIGHGIPEVMQQVLAHRSRITPRVALLKPLSSAISIGTGGPYGAEGPVIATGGALGSLLGQLIAMTATERKILLSAGAAAAMTAVFGSPVAATLLAVELLLFEFRARSLVPVALAAVAAQSLRFAWGGAAVLFPMEPGVLYDAPLSALGVAAIIGVAAGVLGVVANTAVHKAEACFARLPVHWMWCPVIGGGLVGVAGWIEPRVFGAGYGVIEDLLAGHMPLAMIAGVCGLKLAAWVLSLGSGTSGGTLAPMLIIGGGLGALVGAAVGLVIPAGLSPGLAALIGMVSFFAGGSRAFFASIVLGVEITGQAAVLWPIATAATVAMGGARLLSSRSIMTSPVEQRGVRVFADLDVDAFAHVSVAEVMDPAPPTIFEETTVGELADRIGRHDPELIKHSALLIVDANKDLVGLVTRRTLVTAVEQGRSAVSVTEIMTRDLVCVHPDEQVRDAVERMHVCDIGRVPVVEREAPRKLRGYLGRVEVLAARRMRWSQENEVEAGWLHRG